jgi:hypothetical protein
MGLAMVKRFGVFVSLCVLCATLCAEPAATLESNFEYRQSWGDLGELGAIQSDSNGDKRAIRLSGDVEPLLHLCQSSPDWRKDAIYQRLAHANPFTTIGCREKKNPSLHAVFYKKRDGTREAWVHFDLHGPQSTWMHTTEVVRNRMTFGRTSQLDVYRSLVREKEGSGAVPEGRYVYSAQAKHYLNNIIGPKALTATTALAWSGTTTRQWLGAGASGDHYRDRLAYALVQNATMQTIEFGFSAFLHQDDTFKPSGRQGIGIRSAKALLHTVVAPGRDGPEVAFPRIAAAMLTPRALYWWHPGQPRPVASPWSQTAFLMGRYVVRSLWTEFGPDFRKALHKTVPEFLR